MESRSAFLRARETGVEGEREGESGSCLSLDVGRGPQGLNLIKGRASDAVSGRRVGNGWRRKDGEFSIESRAKSGTPL